VLDALANGEKSLSLIALEIQDLSIQNQKTQVAV
jgi:hypothetical protein